MFNRKSIYILLTAVLGTAIVVALILTFMGREPSGTEKKVYLAETGESAEIIIGQNEAADEKSPADDQHSDGQQDHPLVMRLLNSFQNRQIFGAFRLESLIVHDTDPSSSRATIADMQTGSSRTYFINDTLPDDSRLVDIQQSYVVLEKSGVRKRIDLYSSGGKHRSGSRGPGFTRIDENEYELNPYSVFRGDAANVLDFSMKVHSRDGEMEGIEVSDIEKSPLLRTLGVREGDVLLEVNSKPVDSLLNGVKACMNAYYSDDVQLKVRRGKEIITLQYHLFWEGQGSWTPMEVLNSRAVSSLFEGEMASHLF